MKKWRQTKSFLLLGKLNGTRTFKTQLLEKPDLDDVEKFLLEFETYKVQLENLDFDIIHIDSDDEFKDLFLLEKSLGVFFTTDYTELYVASKTKHYIITTQNVSHESLSIIFSDENITKYVLNSYTFLKWLGDKEITPKNVFDIPTYIKLLTNLVDAFKSEKFYLNRFSNYSYSKDTNKNSIILSSFILLFGEYLDYYASKFEINTIANLLNQNAFYEVNILSKKPVGSCIIEVKVSNFELAVNKLSAKILEEYKGKLYTISPLNRIIPCYTQEDTTDLVKESLIEDFSNTILNELYNDNIPVSYDLDYGVYKIVCKQKNVTNIINVLQSTFYEVFNTIFDEIPEVTINLKIVF